MKMGLQYDDESLPRRRTRLRLSEAFKNVSIKYKTDRGVPVLYPMSDSYFYVVPVLDLLIYGISKNVLNVCFEQLHTDEKSTRVEVN